MGNEKENNIIRKIRKTSIFVKIHNIITGKNEKKDFQSIDIIKEIREASIVYFLDDKEYKEKIKSIAEKIESDEIINLTNYFYKNFLEYPKEIKNHMKALGAWIELKQNIIFSIFEEIGEPAVPTLKIIAFGKYDWTQIRALQVLCIFAEKGIHKSEIIKDIIKHLDEFRYETYISVIVDFFPMISNSELIKDTLKNEISKMFMDNEDIIDIYDAINALSHYEKESGKEYFSFLYDLAFGKGLEDRNPILDGAVISRDESGNESVSWVGREAPVKEEHKMNAALLCFYIEPENKDIYNLLDNWAKIHEDERTRNYINNLLNKSI